jgi:DNA repair photolyase
MKMSWAIYMSSFIDPFLELEEHYHNTQSLATTATDVGIPIYFLTRKKVPGWAYDLLKQNKYSYMQFSINTPDPDDWARLSPRAISLKDNLEQVREMHRQGIYVSIQVNPIIAGITSNNQIVDLIHILAGCGANHLIFKFVEIVYPSVKGMIEQHKVRFGDERGAKFEALFTQNIGGVRTIAEEYRKAGLDLFAVECKKAGVTMSLCYEYEYERNPDGSVKNKTGISMGAKYLTSDQCHGHRVPVHVKQADGLFHPLEVCPPAGCLTCGDKGPVPCGSSLLGEAKAWTPADLAKGLVLDET